MNYRCNTTFRAKNKKYFAVGDVIDRDEWLNLESYEQSNFGEYSGWVDDEDMEDEDDTGVNLSMMDDMTNTTIDPYDSPETFPNTDIEYGGGSSGGGGAEGDWC